MVDIVIFEGNEIRSPAEELLVTVRHAALRDNLAKLLLIPEVSGIYLITNQPEFSSYAAGNLRVIVNRQSPADFHFGRQLLEVVREFNLKAVLCMGGAAVPLIETAELAEVCKTISGGEKKYVTNNVQSADIIAFNHAGALGNYSLPATDNALVLLLRYDAGFQQNLMPTTLGTQFDIDTPTDLLVLADSPFGGPHLRAALSQMSLDTAAVRQIKAVLRRQFPEVALIGRVGAPAIALLNSSLKVRLRIYSEERGMKALGRIERNEVKSLLGFWLAEIGPVRFFSYLAETADAALIDTRVLFAHQKRTLSDADRFYSDLGLYENIADPFVRDFTEAAVNCPIPVLLGGHSLVAGCLWAFIREIG